MNTNEPDQPVMYIVRRNMYMPGITRVPIDIFGDIRESVVANYKTRALPTLWRCRIGLFRLQ